MEPRFLDLPEVLEIHRSHLELYGGTAGLRDPGLLESALAMPRAGIHGQYLHSDLFEMAAAYLYHVTKNHPFVDGNKRVGAATALVFLEINGIEATCSNPALVELVLGVAEGKVSKSAVAEFLRRHGGQT